ncbi:unnamed protein product [Dovyalis caffra]|uniref:Uncharacterized protein n=1 Tax=Dovyalis caffra TaxID=77055 RepID=A0AAV1SBS1_9ROSI|nr:unnamed protein product [Dovyalis caffra]
MHEKIRNLLPDVGQAEWSSKFKMISPEDAYTRYDSSGCPDSRHALLVQRGED